MFSYLTLINHVYSFWVYIHSKYFLLQFGPQLRVRYWEGVREVLKELLRSWQLSRKKREKKLNGGGGLYWRGPPQLPVYRSQWKIIFPIEHISFRKGLDSMLKLIWNYINPIGFAVQPCYNILTAQESMFADF